MSFNKKHSANVDTKKQDGANLVEYALLVSFIAVVAVIAVESFGNNVSVTFSMITSTVDPVL